MPIKFEAITAKRLDLGIFLEELEDAAEDITEDFAEYFEMGVVTWNETVIFEEKTDVDAREAVAQVDTDNEIYEFVHNGVRPQTIGDEDTIFVFNEDYSAKTKVGSIKSFPGGSSGDEVVVRGPIETEGFEGRNFSELIKRKRKKQVMKTWSEALKRAARKSGHSI